MAYNQYYPYQQQPQQIQNTGFISVRNVEEAMRYPVAPGNSVTFKDETAPYIYTKTMGFSQFDRPIFERYRITKEDMTEEQPTKEPHECGCKALRDEIENLKTRVKEIEDELNKYVSKDETKSNVAPAKQVSDTTRNE